MKNYFSRIFLIVALLLAVVGILSTEQAQAIGLCRDVGVPGLIVTIGGVQYSNSATVNVPWNQPVSFNVSIDAEPNSPNSVSYPGGSYSYTTAPAGGRNYTTTSLTSNGTINVGVTQQCTPSVSGEEAPSNSFTVTLQVSVPPPTASCTVAPVSAGAAPQITFNINQTPNTCYLRNDNVALTAFQPQPKSLTTGSVYSPGVQTAGSHQGSIYCTNTSSGLNSGWQYCPYTVPAVPTPYRVNASISGTGGSVSPSYRDVSAQSTTNFTVTPSSSSYIINSTVDSTDQNCKTDGLKWDSVLTAGSSSSYRTGTIGANCTYIFSLILAVPSTPPPPSATAGSCGTQMINVSWSAVSGATSYQLRDGTTVIYDGASTSYSHTGLVPDSNHSYTVRATNSAGSSAYSSAVSRLAPSTCVVNLPDLTASVPNPAIATQGVAQMYTADVTNNGNASASGTIRHIFQFDEDSNHSTGVIHQQDTTTTSFAANGGSRPISSTYTFNTAGTKYVRACADNNISMVGTVSESNEGNNCSASWQSVTVSVAPPVPTPDLTASNVTPVTVTPNVATPFYSTISNVGTGPTGPAGSTFYNLFQISTGPGGTGTVTSLIPAASMNVLAAGGSSIATYSYTFPAAGTYYMRTCADKNTAISTGTVTESNEGNNCSPAWTTITVGTTCTPPPAFRPATSGFTPGLATVGGSIAIRCDFGAQFDSISPAFTGASGCTWNGFTGTVANYTCTATQAGMHTVYCNTFTVPPPGSNYCTTQNAMGSLSVSGAPTFPDLTAGAITPTSATEGAATTYSATISNTGSAAASGTITHLFQFDENSDHTAVDATRTSTTTATINAGGGTAVVSASYAFASPGTKYIRACADNNASFVGTITESNEGNNCAGAWTSVTIADDNDPEDNLPATIGVDSVTISSPTVRPDGTHYNITVVGHRKAGGNLLRNMYALINFGGSNAGAYRGYITWYRLSDAWPTAQDKKLCSGLGSYAVIQNQAPNNVYGQEYIHLDACNISDSAGGGSTTTAIFTVHFTPTFTSPVTNNDISGLVSDGVTTTPWANFDINFALDISGEGEAGVCEAAHYGCVVGTSTENVNGSSAWTWKCVGSGESPTASCTELKKKPIFEEN